MFFFVHKNEKSMMYFGVNCFIDVLQDCCKEFEEVVSRSIPFTFRRVGGDFFYFSRFN